MPYIFAMAVVAGASIAVQLLAIVLVILTRPRPKPLLWAFWLSALVVNTAIGIAVLLVFRANGTVFGTSTSTVQPAVYVVLGVIALAAALFAATRRGRELIGREAAEDSGGPHPGGPVADRVRLTAGEVKAKADDAVNRGSVLAAILAGVFMAGASPFQLAAIGAMVKNGYVLPVQLSLVVAFSLVTYLVVEIPVLSYTVWPDATSARVAAFSAWLSANKIQIVAGLAAVVGLVLIAKGVTAA
jgi:hypothetical protein